MRQYRWRARSSDGKECSGEILADSEQEVARFVCAHYGCVTGIEKADRPFGVRWSFLHGKTIHNKERATFSGSWQRCWKREYPLRKHWI